MQEEEIAMRAVIYARYSTDNQREASIEDQVRVCKERIEKEGWALTSVYTDHAVSGATVLRAGYQKLLADCRAGAFDVIVTESLDRLSRDLEAVAAFYKQASFAGVRLFTLAEGEINELHIGVTGAMSALYLKNLAQKTRRGLEGRVRKGRSGGGLCYGYDVVNDSTERGGRVINEGEAAVVRRIYQQYATGKSPRRIARDLNRDSIAGPRSAAWGASTINGNARRGTGVLNNEAYVGRLVWNRLRYLKDPDTGKRVSRLNPQSEWVITEVPELRIVDEDLWHAVKARQKVVKADTCTDTRQRPVWDRRRPRYLFSGLIKCGACGGGFTMRGRHHLGCSTAREKGTCTNRLSIRRDVLEATVLDGLRHHLMEPDLFKEFAGEFHREVNRLRMAESAQYEHARHELAKIERRLRKMVDAIADGASARTLMEEFATLETRQDELRALLAKEDPPQALIHPNLAEVYRRKVADLHSALADETIRAEAMELIRSLVDEIVLTPEGQGLRLDLKGELAGILNICAEGKKPGTVSGPRLERQIKVVAGVGFEPTTFRL